MHPLTFWAISTTELAARQRDEALLRAQRDSGTLQPPPLTRDERWVAAIHRWATAPEPETSAGRAAATAADTPPTALQPRLGCA